MVPEAYPKALTGAPVSHVTATAICAHTQGKLPNEGCARNVGCHVATARRLHGHRPHDVLVGLGQCLSQSIGQFS